MTEIAARIGRRMRPWQIVLLGALVYVCLTLARYDWDPLSFAIVGTKFDPGLPDGTQGYDGQFAYQIARDPLGASPYLDVPAYRYQRMLYPLLAWCLSLGNERLLPWALILINLIALPAGTALIEAILAGQGVNRWYALTYGFFIGLLMPVRLDLTEPLAFLLVQAGVLAFSRQRLWPSAIWFTLAALTRETTLLFVGGYGLFLLATRRWRTALGWVGAAVGPFLAWQGLLYLWLGSWGVGSGGEFATPFEIIPFRGWWIMARFNMAGFLFMSLLILPLALLPAGFSFVAALRALLNGQHSPEGWALLTHAAIFPFLPISNVLDPMGLSRFTAGLVVAVLNYGAARKAPRTLNYALLWIFTAMFLYNDAFLPRG